MQFYHIENKKSIIYNGHLEVITINEKFMKFTEIQYKLCMCIAAPPSPRTPSRRTPSHTVGSPQSSLPPPSFSPGRPSQGYFMSPPAMSPRASPHKFCHSPMAHSSYQTSDASQTTFRTLLEPGSMQGGSEMSTVYPMMNGHYENSLNQINPGNSSNAAEGIYSQMSRNNSHYANSQQMSEVFPMPHQNMPAPSSPITNTGFENLNLNQGIPLVNVDSKVYADLSSPKKAKLDTSRSSDQLSEEELMLHLSESE